MKGITFEDLLTNKRLHSYDDLKLILNSKEIGSPETKVNKIDIPGGDSSLDLTDFFGEPKYEDLTHKFYFSTIVKQAQFLSLFSTVKNALHGKKMRIILDDDPLFYYVGRIKVSSFTNEKNIGIISIECDCEPYKYKLNPMFYSVTMPETSTKEITLLNGRKRTVPEVTIAADSNFNIVYQGSNVWDLGSGSYMLPELELVEGENYVTITGKGTITFTWQEANL